jgi:hypothetical protein
MLTRRAALAASAALAVRPLRARPATLDLAHRHDLADIPVTDGAPDQGTEGIRFMGYTMYDPLVAWDLSSATEPAKLVPGLATKWTQDPADPTKWIFELRQGVKFHHGAPFTADDVIFSIERTLNDKSPAFDRLGRAVLIAALWPIVGYRKIDDLQGRAADQRRRHGDALAAQPLPDRQRRQLREGRQGLAGLPQVAVGHRPVEDEVVDPRERAELERNTEYWNKDRIPKSERLVLLPIPTSRPAPRRCCRAGSTGSRRRRPIRSKGCKAAGCKIETNAIPHMWPYTLSHAAGRADRRHPRAQGDEPGDRPRRHRQGAERARRAGGRLRAADHPWFGTPSFKIKYDPAEAEALLAEAGYGPGKKLKTKIAISTSGSGQMYPLIMNEAVQQQWAEVGIDVEFQVMDWNALLNFMRQGAKAPEAAPFGAINVSWNTMDPHNAFMRFVDSQQVPPKGSNWGYINDPVFDALAKEARNTRTRRNSTRCWPGSTPRWSTTRCSSGSCTTCGRTRSRPGQGLRPSQELVRRLLAGDRG